MLSVADTQGPSKTHSMVGTVLRIRTGPCRPGQASLRAGITRESRWMGKQLATYALTSQMEAVGSL
jgi:hypothetical protein